MSALDSIAAYTLVLAGLTALTAGSYVRNERAALRLAERCKALLERRGVPARERGDLAPGEGVFELTVPGAPDTWCELGVSTEDPTNLATTPTLEARALVLDAAGATVTLRAGAKMPVRKSFERSRRRFVEALTFGERVEQRYSLEVPGGTTLRLRGSLGGEEGAPHLRAAAVRVLEPIDGVYTLDPTATAPVYTPMGCLFYPLVAGALWALSRQPAGWGPFATVSLWLLFMLPLSIFAIGVSAERETIERRRDELEALPEVTGVRVAASGRASGGVADDAEEGAREERAHGGATSRDAQRG